MTYDEQITNLEIAASLIRRVVRELDPTSNKFQALSVAQDQITWTVATLKRDYPPERVEVAFRKIKPTSECKCMEENVPCPLHDIEGNNAG